METIIQATNQTGFKIRTENSITFFVCEQLEQAGFRNAFSTRISGISPLPDSDLNLGFFSGDDPENVLENRRSFLKAIGADQWPIVNGKQVHSADLRIVNKQSESLVRPPECDGVVSKLTGILASVQTADCTPVLIADPVTGAFAAVHAGWRGTASRIVETAVSTLKSEFGVTPADCIAAIGPAAGACCYEVGADVMAQFKSSFSYANELFSHQHGDKAKLDVPSANAFQLIKAGLNPQNIHTSSLCTMCRTDLFFSYRKEKNRGPVGRLLSVIGKIDNRSN